MLQLHIFKESPISLSQEQEPVFSWESRKLVGKLMYLTIIKPNIIFAVNKLCQFASSPKPSHLQAAHKVLHYLKDTIG